MKKNLKIILVLMVPVIVGLLGCLGNHMSGSRKSTITYICTGVVGTQDMKDTFIVDKNKAAEIASEIKIAAAADASNSIKYLDSLKGNASLSFSSSLSRTIKKYSSRSTNLSEDFWQQQFRFDQAACLYEHLRSDKNISDDLKTEIINDERDLIKSQNIYQSSVQKKNQN